MFGNKNSSNTHQHSLSSEPLSSHFGLLSPLLKMIQLVAAVVVAVEPCLDVHQNRQKASNMHHLPSDTIILIHYKLRRKLFFLLSFSLPSFRRFFWNSFSLLIFDLLPFLSLSLFTLLYISEAFLCRHRCPIFYFFYYYSTEFVCSYLLCAIKSSGSYF